MCQTVLLVDDDEDSNFISERVIKKSSIADTITCVKNGNEALQYISEKNDNRNLVGEECIQIIFLDLHMPVMDGFDFLAQLTAKIPNYTDRIKIYILTSSSNPADIAKARQYMIEGYINKPLDVNKIKSVMGVE